MKVTPLDLRQQRFKSVMRGFDRDEVTQFLSEVADDYEQALRDAALAGDVPRAVEILEDHLRGTLDSVRAALAEAPATSIRKRAPRPRRSAR